jgi:hypothetical protein
MFRWKGIGLGVYIACSFVTHLHNLEDGVELEENMKVFAARALLAVTVSAACVSPGFAEVQKASSEAQTKMYDKMQRSSSDKLILFDRRGTFEESFDLDPSAAKYYGHLQDLLKSNKSPIGTCKKPTPTPPPGCVVCEDGHIICSKAFQKSSENIAPHSSSKTGNKPQ